MAIQNPVAPETVVSRPPLPVRSTTTDENQYLLDVEAVEAATPAYNTSLNDVAQNAYENAGVAFNNATESASSASSASASSASASGFATASSNSASESLGYANQAASSANNLGSWSNLSGAYSPPVAAEHNGSAWQLLEPVALIENEEPGVSAKWKEIITSSKSTNRGALLAFINM